MTLSPAPKTVSTMSRAALLGLCLLAGLTPRADAASAAPFTVTRTADDTAPGSLRAAISQASATGGTITFAIPNSDPGYSSAANTDTITLALGPLVVPAGLSIVGPTAPAAMVIVSGAAGANQSGVFTVTAGTVVFTNLTITNGRSAQGAGDIQNAATLTLTNCTVTAGTSFGGTPGGDILNTGALTMNSCTVSGGSTFGGDGAGINNSGAGATLTMTGCTISGNTGGNGGNGGGIASGGTLLLTGCTLSGNSASAMSSTGGGLNNTGMATLNNCTLSGNTGGGQFGGGGGTFSSGSLTLNNCLVTGNFTANGGGGIDSTGTLTLSACTISSNQANRNPNGSGGGLLCSGAVQMTNCLVVNNYATSFGGMYNGGALTMINSTFAGNVALNGSGGLLSGPATLLNDIFYFDTISPNGPTLVSEIVAASGTAGPTVTSSDVQGGYAGTGNLSADPQFVRNPGTNSSTDLGDEHLKLTSPAVHSGTNGPGVPLTDIVGTPRPAPPAKPSMGAYEVPGSMGFSAQGGFTITGTQNVSTGAQVVAKFLPGPTPIASFTATVDTGDGSVVPGIITPDPTASAVSQVTVSHTYATSGVFPITVTISGPNNTPTATVTSSAAIQPVLSSVSFPSPVPGGTVLTATVTLSGPALADTVVGLSSSDSSVVRLNRAVVVPAGASSATFAINTFRSHTTKTVTITATLGAVTLTKDLTITGR